MTSQVFTVDNYPEPFETKKAACFYAKVASTMFGKSRLIVRLNGDVIEEFYQGRKVREKVGAT